MTVYKSGITLQSISDSSQEQNNRALHDALAYLLGQESEIASTGVGADTEFSVAHSLGRKPDHVELLVPSSGTTSAYITIRPSGTAWTSKIVYLKCNTANAALKIRIR